MTMDALVLCLFVLTYAGMAAGRVPGLKLDRAWVALTAATVMLVAGAIDGALPLQAVLKYLDAGALILLFALMVVSAQVGVSGLYARIADAMLRSTRGPAVLLAFTVAAGGLLSAVLVNDIVAFALAPLLCQVLPQRRLDPRPFLIALALSSNAGSAATLIGNPQNILIGQAGALDFWAYTGFALMPSLLSLLVVHLTVWAMWRKHWLLVDAASPAADSMPDPPAAANPAKALIAIAVLLALFALPLPREISALAVAVAVMVSRRIESRALVAQVDWNLLLLFVGLFIVTGAAAQTQWAQQALTLLPTGLPESAWGLAGLSLIGSNLIGNVPLTLLFLQAWPDVTLHTLHGLALLSTLAGNALLIGSVVNLIVAERASACGVKLGFMTFARVGVPVTLVSMALATLWWQSLKLAGSASG